MASNAEPEVSSPPIARGPRDLTLVVALGAALWATDAPWRVPLAGRVDAPTIVLAEHAVLVLVLSPFLPRALRALAGTDLRTVLAVLGIGVGASAVATTLFTMSFRYGDPVTPAVIQKLQPIIAIVGAAWSLHERIRPVFALVRRPGAGRGMAADVSGPVPHRRRPGRGGAARARRGDVVGRGHGVGPLGLHLHRSVGTDHAAVRGGAARRRGHRCPVRLGVVGAGPEGAPAV